MKARSFYEQAIRIDEKKLGPEYPTVSHILLELALLARVTGEYTKTKPLYERALTIYEKSFINNPDFENLRRSPDFESIIASHQERVGINNQEYYFSFRVE